MNTVDANQAAYELTEVLESATSAELAGGSSLMEDVGDLLSRVGIDELMGQLREAEGVTSGLVVMGESLSPATYCLLVGTHQRAEMALRRAEALVSQE